VRTPFVVIAVLVVALVGLDAVLGGGKSSPPAARLAPVPVIAGRVEALRGLRYARVPRAKAVTPTQARREGIDDFDRTYPRVDQLRDEELLTLLGLAPAGLSLRAQAASLYGEGVAGYYDPRTKRLRTVSGAATGTRALGETVLAHELTHALEDQRFGLLGQTAESSSGFSDVSLAHLALIEGTATTVMERYLTRYFSPSEALAGALSSAFAPEPSMPPFLRAQTEFPYVGGAAFVAELLRRAGERWDLINVADRLRPPASTEQVLHPERYLEADVPKRVTLRLGGVLGPGWSVAGSGTWGEFQTRELLDVAGVGGAAAAAAGWGGDRWVLWRRAPLGDGCRAPCGSADVLAMRWRWDTPRDRDEFAAALRQYAARHRAVVAVRGGAVTLAIAPSAALANRVAAAP
jgi:hypothetical protein